MCVTLSVHTDCKAVLYDLRHFLMFCACLVKYCGFILTPEMY